MRKSAKNKATKAGANNPSPTSANTLSQSGKASVENTLDLLLTLQDQNVLHFASVADQIDYLNKHGDSTIRPKTGRQSNPQKINEKKLLLLASGTHAYMDAGSAVKKYPSPESIKSQIKKIKATLNKYTKDEIAELYANSLIQIEFLDQKILALEGEKTYLRSKELDGLVKRKETVLNQTTGKNNLYAPNNARMQECLDQVLSAGSANKNLSKATFDKFCRLVKKKYPIPPVIPAPRLTAEEKLQDKKAQAADREALKRNDWPPTTLRHFFETALNVKISELIRK